MIIIIIIIIIVKQSCGYHFCALEMLHFIWDNVSRIYSIQRAAYTTSSFFNPQNIILSVYMSLLTTIPVEGFLANTGGNPGEPDIHNDRTLMMYDVHSCIVQQLCSNIHRVSLRQRGNT